MKILKSYVNGKWHRADQGLVPTFNPSTEEAIAQVSSSGIDFGAVLRHAHQAGGPALRSLTFAERGALLKDMSKILRGNREELLDLSRQCSGTTLSDGAFDIDGAGGTLAYYAHLSKSSTSNTGLLEGEGVQLARTEAVWGQHLLFPFQGAAVHINAFNFPVWGFGEKAACALLAGMPVITKPATATALVAERAVELIIEAGVLPEGSLQLICGSTGNLLEHLGPQDVIAFTGSADTALTLRSVVAVSSANPRFNVEADSLNAAIFGGGEGAVGDQTRDLFLRDVLREITQKAGQKCTAVRRILVPADQMDEVERALVAGLETVLTGNPIDPSVHMGPLATADQLDAAIRGVDSLSQSCRIVYGTGKRSDGLGSPVGKGYFFAPTLLDCSDADSAPEVHHREVFGPVATLVPYDGTPAEAARIVSLAGGTLVTSLYSDDLDWSRQLIQSVGPSTGRIYVGSEGMANEAPGSGAALPQLMHGGPGRCGGGAELGGWRGVKLYMQRIALQGHRSVVEALNEST